MADSDRALVAALRAELASIEPGRPCDRAAEVEGLGTGAVRGERPALGRLMIRLLRGGTAPLRPLAWESAPDHCRAAWLRGRFLARGSLSVAQGRLHLEFVVPPEDAAALGVRLASVGLPAGVRLRRGRGVVTWKGADEIGTFLRWIGAGSSLLELESRQVGRAVRGDLNRLLNAESANLERIAVAAARQLDAIAKLEADGRLAALPERVRDVAAARRAIPEASLGELATELAVARGRIQRALERIEAAALHGADEVPALSPRGPRAARAERPGHDGPPEPSFRGPAVA